MSIMYIAHITKFLFLACDHYFLKITSIIKKMTPTDFVASTHLDAVSADV